MEATLFELLGLPETPRVEFESPPLALALCQIKFTPILNIANPAFVGNFQKAIEEQYSITNIGEQVEIEFGFGPSETGLNRQSRTPQWRFSDDTDTWVVVLTQEFLSIETRSYGNFKEFLDRLNHVLNALYQHIKPKLITRLGLRYINEIRPDDLSLVQVMKPQFRGLLSAPELIRYNQLAVQQVVLRFSEQRGIQIHHGYLPGGSTVAPRASAQPLDGPFYLLDFDVFREFKPTRGRITRVNDICNLVADFNKTIYQLFRWCISDEYLATLEVRREYL
jgi:uncharacterized protein (TIGR04255 family)